MMPGKRRREGETINQSCWIDILLREPLGWLKRKDGMFFFPLILLATRFVIIPNVTFVAFLFNRSAAGPSTSCRVIKTMVNVTTSQSIIKASFVIRASLLPSSSISSRVYEAVWRWLPTALPRLRSDEIYETRDWGMTGIGRFSVYVSSSLGPMQMMMNNFIINWPRFHDKLFMTFEMIVKYY